MTNDTEMTALEGFLRDGLALRVAAIAGELAKQLGHPAPTPDQLAELNRVIGGSTTTFVGQLRARGGNLTDLELAEALDHLALGAVEHVLGAPQPRDVVH